MLRQLAQRISASTGRNRALGAAITVFVVIQLLLPLHYYVARRDRHDERFAWRMFSPMRMTRCEPKVILDGKPFDLGSEFHEAWIKTAERGRFSVIEAMGARMCETHPKSEVRFSIDCTYIDREPRTFGGYDMCTVPLL
jgi:hypothetical protein